jgi:hypothetical protein
MGEALETKASRICNYFTHVHANGNEQIREEGSDVLSENATVAAVMISLMNHFKEKLDSIFILTDVNM